MKLDADKVRWHRDSRGWTLETAAEKAEVALGTLLRAEHGEDIRPSSGRRIARAFGVDVSELVPEKPRRAEEPVLSGKAEPREAGPSLLDRAQDAARQDQKKDSQAAARAIASEGVPQFATGYGEDQFRAELRRLGFPDEYFEGFIWPLVVEVIRLRQENTELREENAVPKAQLQERERVLSASDDELRQFITEAPTENLHDLIRELVADYQPQRLEDLRGRKPSAEDTLRITAFSRAHIIVEELRYRGEAAPENYVLALRKHTDALTSPESQHVREDQEVG
jgi:transcriptional regulator with XRE-family HTH domain